MPSQLVTLCQEARLYLAWNSVKAKGAGGGIDGVSVLDFEKEKRKQIPKAGRGIEGTCKSSMSAKGNSVRKKHKTLLYCVL